MRSRQIKQKQPEARCRERGAQRGDLDLLKYGLGGNPFMAPPEEQLEGVSHRDGPPTGPDALAAVLTAREIEIAQLVGAAKRNKEIARDLCLSQQTVERHLRNIFAKLAIRSRVELALLVTSPALLPEE